MISGDVQVEKENLYSAFYKLTDSRSQITSYVFDVGTAHHISDTSFVAMDGSHCLKPKLHFMFTSDFFAGHQRCNLAR